MRFPFVSLAVYQDTVRRAEAAESRAEKATERYHSVCERMLNMKREGFTSKPIQEPLKPAESLIPAELEFAIEQRAGGDPAYRRWCLKYAQSELAKGIDAGEIRERIEKGDGNDD